MADIRIRVADDFLTRIKAQMGMPDDFCVMQEALTVLNWVVEERLRGRLVVSADSEGENVERLACAWLDDMKPEEQCSEG